MKNSSLRLMILVLFFSLTIGLNGCFFSSSQETAESPKSETEIPNTETGKLRSFASRQAFEDYLKRGLILNTSSAEKAYADSPLLMATGATTAPAIFTTTNLQETGVDEADRLKSDGRYLFILNANSGDSATRLTIRELTQDAPAENTLNAGSRLIASLLLPDKARFEQAYLATTRPAGQPNLLLAIGERSDAVPYSMIQGQAQTLVAKSWFAPWQWRQGKIELQWIDIANTAAPSLGRRLSIDGYYVASRRIGETLYVVSRFVPQVANVAESKLDDLLPKWSVDGVTQGNLVDADRCYQPKTLNVQPAADLVVVSAFNLATPSVVPRTRCLAGSSEAVYVSPDALYLATSRTDYTQASSSTADMVPSYSNESTTDLHKFALSAGDPEYRGSGSVSGHLGWEQDKKAFRMGEHQGVLRIATSIGQDWNTSSSTRLSLLQESEGRLITVATLPNAARPAPLGKPGERLYAIRYVGARAFLVTFRVTDPLYVLDLSSTTDPRIAGELAIPGYSDYLHPLGERWLIGIGKDAVADNSNSFADGRGAWYQGVKVALFDILDPAKPREVNSLIIGKRGSQSAALTDHHAFTLMPTGNSSGELARLALPIQRHDIANMGDSTNPRTWHDWTNTGLHLYSVQDTGLVAHAEMLAEQRSLLSNEKTSPTVDASTDRGFLIGNEAHYLHGQEIWARHW